MTAFAEASRPTGEFRTRVEWIDTDASGIYHNSTVTRFVEAAEATLMSERGVRGYFAVAPRVRYEVDFEAPLFFGQGVTVTVALAHVGTASMRFEFEVWGEAFGDRPRGRAACGAYVTVHLSGKHGVDASNPWPAAWVAALSA